MINGKRLKFFYSISNVSTPSFLLIVHFRRGHYFVFSIQETDPSDPDKVGTLSSCQAELSAIFFTRKFAFVSPFDFRTLS